MQAIFLIDKAKKIQCTFKILSAKNTEYESTKEEAVLWFIASWKCNSMLATTYVPGVSKKYGVANYQFLTIVIHNNIIFLAFTSF